MKILVVQESNWLTRNPHQQHHLMERMVTRGHEVRVIDYDIDWKKETGSRLLYPRTIFENVHKIIPEVSIYVIRPLSLRLPVLEYFTLIITHRKEIIRQIHEFKPDFVIGFGILNAWIAARHAKNHSIPFIYYWIDALDTLIPEKIFQTIGCVLEKQTLRNSTKVIAINKTLMEYAINLGADPRSTSLIGAGIDRDRFNPSIDGTATRSSYGIGKDDIVLFFMGWLYQFSGLKEVVLEFARSRRSVPNLKILIVGDGDAFLDLKRIRDEHQLGDNLILTGKQPYEKIPEFIAASDICLLPADPKEKIMQDIVPIKMYEYMAVGKPVICTKLPGIMREFGNENGVIYVESFQTVLDVAINLIQKRMINLEGLKASKFVEHNSWDEIVGKFDLMLKSIL